MLLVAVLVTALAPLTAQPALAAPEDAGERNPQFLTGPNAGKPNDIAISYLRAHPDRYGVSAADLNELTVARSYTSKHNGVTHVHLSQRFKDLEVFGATATVSIASDGSVVFAGHSLVSGLQDRPSGTTALGAAQAVEAAADALDLADPRNPQVISRSAGPAQRTVVSGSGISDQPIPARLGWQKTNDGLRLAVGHRRLLRHPPVERHRRRNHRQYAQCGRLDQPRQHGPAGHTEPRRRDVGRHRR
jgi:hypothetical protein